MVVPKHGGAEIPGAGNSTCQPGPTGRFLSFRVESMGPERYTICCGDPGPFRQGAHHGVHLAAATDAQPYTELKERTFHAVQPFFHCGIHCGKPVEFPSTKEMTSIYTA